jgi:hypothetical protein
MIVNLLHDGSNKKQDERKSRSFRLSFVALSRIILVSNLKVTGLVGERVGVTRRGTGSTSHPHVAVITQPGAESPTARSAPLRSPPIQPFDLYLTGV